MAHFVADTHALVWYLGGSSQIGAQARAAFDGALQGEHRVDVPAIVLAELVMLAERRPDSVDLPRIIETLRAMPGV
jgi:predicted nucleic acid-binding protein